MNTFFLICVWKSKKCKFTKVVATFFFRSWRKHLRQITNNEYVLLAFSKILPAQQLIWGKNTQTFFNTAEFTNSFGEAGETESTHFFWQLLRKPLIFFSSCRKKTFFKVFLLSSKRIMKKPVNKTATYIVFL